MTIIGNKIDNVYVNALNPPASGKPNAAVSQRDLAKAALANLSTNADTARDTVNSYIKEAKEDVATLVMFYNATGATMTLRSSNDSSGHLYKYPFDSIVENGQWSVFLHVHASSAATGSIGVVAYNIADSGIDPVAVIAWNNPYSSSATAMADCWSSGGYQDTQWSSIYTLAENGGTSGAGNADGYKYGYAAPYSIGQTGTPILQVTVEKTA